MCWFRWAPLKWIMFGHDEWNSSSIITKRSIDEKIRNLFRKLGNPKDLPFLSIAQLGTIKLASSYLPLTMDSSPYSCIFLHTFFYLHLLLLSHPIHISLNSSLFCIFHTKKVLSNIYPLQLTLLFFLQIIIVHSSSVSQLLNNFSCQTFYFVFYYNFFLPYNNSNL
jgi:hypothetical protein